MVLTQNRTFQEDLARLAETASSFSTDEFSANPFKTAGTLMRIQHSARYGGPIQTSDSEESEEEKYIKDRHAAGLRMILSASASARLYASTYNINIQGWSDARCREMNQFFQWEEEQRQVLGAEHSEITAGLSAARERETEIETRIAALDTQIAESVQQEAQLTQQIEETRSALAAQDERVTELEEEAAACGITLDTAREDAARMEENVMRDDQGREIHRGEGLIPSYYVMDEDGNRIQLSLMDQARYGVANLFGGATANELAEKRLEIGSLSTECAARREELARAGEEREGMQEHLAGLRAERGQVRDFIRQSREALGQEHESLLAARETTADYESRLADVEARMQQLEETKQNMIQAMRDPATREAIRKDELSINDLARRHMSDEMWAQYAAQNNLTPNGEPVAGAPAIDAPATTTPGAPGTDVPAVSASLSAAPAPSSSPFSSLIDRIGESVSEGIHNIADAARPAISFAGEIFGKNSGIASLASQFMPAAFGASSSAGLETQTAAPEITPERQPVMPVRAFGA